MCIRFVRVSIANKLFFILFYTPILAMLLPGPDLHCAVPLALWEFSNIFLRNTGEDEKKSYHLSARPLALCHMVNPSLVITLCS